MKYATMIRDGFTVPLIGIPAEETEERCVKCGKVVDLMQTVITEAGTVCGDCNRKETE